MFSKLIRCFIHIAFFALPFHIVIGQSKIDSLINELSKKAPEDKQKYWSAFRPYFVDNILPIIGDSVIGTGDINKDNQTIEMRVRENRKNGTNTQYTFYYLTPATYADATINIHLWEDNYSKKVLSSDPTKIKRVVFGRFSLIYYTMNAEGINTPWKDFTYSANYLGYMIIAKNIIADKQRADQVYEKPKEVETNSNSTSPSITTKIKIACPDCSGKGTYKEETSMNCTPCWGKGTVKCGSCGGGGRIYTASRDRSEYCPYCHGSGTKTCLSCNGKGKKYGNKNVKCKRCNGTAYIIKE